MNFLITTNADYKNDFDLNEITHKNFRIFFDDNWTRNEDSITKGTANNYCTVKFGDTIEITHNELRDFPLWYNNHTFVS